MMQEAGDAGDSVTGMGEQVHRITVPYAAQEDLELLTEDLIERCLDSSFKGGDVLGQHPDTGEDVSCPPPLPRASVPGFPSLCVSSPRGCG